MKLRDDQAIKCQLLQRRCKNGSYKGHHPRAVQKPSGLDSWLSCFHFTDGSWGQRRCVSEPSNNGMQLWFRPCSWIHSVTHQQRPEDRAQSFPPSRKVSLGLHENRALGNIHTKFCSRLPLRCFVFPRSLGTRDKIWVGS